jgi:hypothetical protein
MVPDGIRLEVQRRLRARQVAAHIAAACGVSPVTVAKIAKDSGIARARGKGWGSFRAGVCLPPR